MAFATSGEAAYPFGLCDALAEGLARALGAPPAPQRSRAQGPGAAAEAAASLRDQEPQETGSADAPGLVGTPADRLGSRAGAAGGAAASAGSCSASASRLIAAAVDLPPSDECEAPSTRSSAALA